MKPTWSIFCFPFFFEIFDTGHEKTDGQSKFKIKNCLPRFFNFVWLQARCQITSVSAFLFYCKWTAAVLRVFFNSNKNKKKCPSVSVYYCLVFSICKRKEKKICLFPCYCKAILIIISPVFCCCFCKIRERKLKKKICVFVCLLSRFFFEFFIFCCSITHLDQIIF